MSVYKFVILINALLLTCNEYIVYIEMSHEKVWSCRFEADNEELFFILGRFLLELFAIVL